MAEIHEDSVDVVSTQCPLLLCGLSTFDSTLTSSSLCVSSNSAPISSVSTPLLSHQGSTPLAHRLSSNPSLPLSSLVRAITHSDMSEKEKRQRLVTEVKRYLDVTYAPESNVEIGLTFDAVYARLLVDVHPCTSNLSDILQDSLVACRNALPLAMQTAVRQMQSSTRRTLLRKKGFKNRKAQVLWPFKLKPNLTTASLPPRPSEVFVPPRSSASDNRSLVHTLSTSVSTTAETSSIGLLTTVHSASDSPLDRYSPTPPLALPLFDSRSRRSPSALEHVG